MVKAAFSLYLGLFFLVITIISFNLIIFGLVLLNQFNEPLSLALNAILIGIILLPIGIVFMSIFLIQAISYWRNYKKQQNNGNY